MLFVDLFGGFSPLFVMLANYMRIHPMVLTSSFSILSIWALLNLPETNIKVLKN